LQMRKHRQLQASIASRKAAQAVEDYGTLADLGMKITTAMFSNMDEFGDEMMDIVDGGIQGWSGMRTFGSFPLVEQAWDIPVGTTPFLLLINEQSWQRQPASVQHAMLKHGGLGIARSSGQAYATINQQIRAALAAAGQPTLMVPDESTQQALVDRSQALHDAWMAASSNRHATYRAAQTLLTQLRSEMSPVIVGGAP